MMGIANDNLILLCLSGVGVELEDCRRKEAGGGECEEGS